MTPAQEEATRLVTMRFWDTESRHIKRTAPRPGLYSLVWGAFCVQVMTITITYPPDIKIIAQNCGISAIMYVESVLWDRCGCRIRVQTPNHIIQRDG